MPRKGSGIRKSRAMSDIEAGLRQLGSGLRGLVRDITHLRGNGKGTRRRKVTPALRLQGRYMGLIRTLPQRKNANVMAIRARKGVNEAIRVARSLKG